MEGSGPKLVFAALLLSGAVQAENRLSSVPPVPVMSALRAVTLQQALEEAEKRQPSLAAVRARIAAAAAEARVPRALWLPRVGVTAQVFEGTANNSTTSFVSVSALDLPRIGSTAVGRTSWRPEPSTLVAVGVRQEIYDFGRISALIAVNDALARAEERRGAGDRLDLRLAVKESYFGVCAARAILSAAEEAYQRAKAHRSLAKAGVESGLRATIELTRSEADLMRFDVGRVRARGGLAVARALLAATVGAPEPSLDAGEEESPMPTLHDLGDAIARADSEAPEIQEARARVAAQAARTGVLTSGLLPDLQLSSTLSGRAGGNTPSSGPVPVGGGWLPTVPNWDVALVLVWPVLDFGVFAQRAASEDQRLAREAEVEVVRQRTRAEVQRAWETAELAQAALPALERALEAARANEAQADARFRGGLGTSIELADAEALRTDAEIQVALGQFDAARAQARLARVIVEDS